MGLGMLAATLGLSACGATSSPDADAPGGTYTADVSKAAFPTRQHVAQTSDLVLRVRNTGDKAIPQLTVTIWTGDADAGAPKAQGAFSVQADDRANNPVWVGASGYPRVAGVTGASVNAAGAVAAQTNTYTFGSLAAGDTRTVTWRVTPVRTGNYDVHYAVHPGVSGSAKLTGDQTTGSFAVKIDDASGCVISATKSAQNCGA